jgi:transposase
METVVERVAGIDVGKADVKVCVRVPGRRVGSRRQEVRTFGTTTRELLVLSDWLAEQGVTLAAMESTGQYWKPVFYLLEDARQCWLVNPQHIKKVPGRKTDVSDAAWLAQLVENGLVRPSFVPPPPVRRLRDLTRYRAALVAERTRETQRLHGVLEDAGIKLSCVVTDVLGVSGRAMLAALISGERDPRRLADLARSRMRVKLPALQEALTGRFGNHHALLCQMMLERIDAVSATVAGLDTAITTAITEATDDDGPGGPAIERLKTIPGVGQRVAEVIIAETGGDMTRFATPGHLSSWAGMCPGNNESAGRHFSGRTRHGNRHLAAALGEAAAAAARTKDTYLAQRYRRLARRRGKTRALVAVGRSILEAAWHVLHDQTTYTDLGAQHFLTHAPNPARRAHRLITELRALGYDLALPDVA